MEKRIAIYCTIISLGIFLSSISFAANLGIITGSMKGTYYQFGLDLEKLTEKHGYNLSIYPSNGSIENIYAVYKRPRTHLGVVQSDVMAFVSRVNSNPVLKKISQKIKMVFPLYNEEVHLIGRRNISDFNDLAGKTVAIGKEGSGTYLTAKLLFEVSGIVPKEIVPTGVDEALTLLRSGKIDAMFYVCGYPVKLFRENITAEDELSLIPIKNKKILEFYQKVVIPSNIYSWHEGAVYTVAVQSVLISFDFKQYNGDNVGRFARIIYDNIDWLRQNGHPKWKSVNLDVSLKGWEQYSYVKKYLKKDAQVQRQGSSEVNPVLKAVKAMLK